MRHRVSSKRFKRASGEFGLMLRTMTTQLFEHGSIVTTLAKAKALRPYAEKIITKAKKYSLSKDTKSHDTNAIKSVTSLLTTESSRVNLVDKITPLFLKRVGGYTRITRLGIRIGDASPQARIELVEKMADSGVTKKNTDKNKDKEVKKASNRTLAKATKEVIKNPKISKTKVSKVSKKETKENDKN